MKLFKSKSTTDTNTIIIGAGPAGLAVAACLAKKGVDYILLEKTDDIAPAWKSHYDRLHLHTAKEYSALPYYPFPKLFARYPARQQVVRYLEDYANHFGIQPKFNHTVTDITCQQQGKKKVWQVTAEVNPEQNNKVFEGTAEAQIKQQKSSGNKSSGNKGAKSDSSQADIRQYTAQNLVIATGYNRVPQLPKWQGLEDFPGTIMHSHEYKNGEPFKDKKVMVVGFGNSGAEIALDLWEHGAKPIQSVRSAVNVLPREVLGQPTLAMGIWQQHLPPKIIDKINTMTSKVLMGDLSKYGLKQLDKGPMENLKEKAQVPMLDVGTIDLIKRGEIIVYPGIEKFEGNEVVFVDGRRESIDAMVLATGYRPCVDEFLSEQKVLKDDGTPKSSGEESELEGLYFCGFYISPAGMFREMAKEAKQIAKQIKK